MIIPHQANLRIVESLSARLNVPIDKFYCNLDRYGNTSAASIPLALDEALRSQRVAKGRPLLTRRFWCWFNLVVRVNQILTK